MTGVVRTLRGDVAADELGVTNSHDHAFLRAATLPGEELDDARAASETLAAFAADGGGALVQWTPASAGRRLDDLAAASGRTGVHVVAATGRHRRRLYPADRALLAMAPDELAATFVADVDERRCGLVKVGVGPGGPDAFERAGLAAAAHASAATGVPVAVHLEDGTGVDEVLAALDRAGTAPARVVLGHLGRHPDPRAVVRTAATGAWVCLDLPSPSHGTTRDGVLRRLELLWDAGLGDRVLLGADTVSASLREVRRARREGVLPTAVAAEARIGAGVADALLRRNPARAWVRSG